MSRSTVKARRPPLAVLIAVLAPLALHGCSQETADPLREGLSLYCQNKLEEALPLFQRAVDRHQEDAEAHAWLAETYRRLGRTDRAVGAARRAIDLDPCSSFAHTVLAWAFNPVYGHWKGADPDSTWRHLLDAAKCDSTDGNVWIGVWLEAIRRGDRASQKRALRLLIDTGFLTRPLLAYNRWMLRDLPENALLLTNGDWDTYPAQALQEIEGVRPDVAIVNRSLLNLPWYARFLRDIYELPLPYTDAELNSLRAYRGEDGRPVTVSSQIFMAWLNQRVSGDFSRPIALSVTVSDLQLAPHLEEHLALAGPYWLWQPEAVTSSEDTTLLAASLADMDPDDFAGSFVSPQDRSPVRITSSDYLVRNISAAGLRYSQVLMEAERFPEADEMIAWVERFEEKTVLGPASAERIAQLRDTLRERTE